MTTDQPLQGIADLAGYFEGSWCLLRLITDRRSVGCGSLIGWANFHPQDGSLLYDESGLLSLGGHRGPASQRYRYEFPAPGVARVCFADGREFHDLELTSGHCDAEHICGEDRYRGRFHSLDANHWQVIWSVEGPRKALALESHYLRYRGPPRDADLALFVPCPASATRGDTWQSAAEPA